MLPKKTSENTEAMPREEDAASLAKLVALVKRNLSLLNLEIEGSEFERIQEYKANQLAIRTLLTSGQVDDNGDEHGFAKFHAACACDDASLAKALLRHGDDVNRRISADSPLWPGYTPLHFAAHFSVDVVKLLLAEGGNLLSEDAKGVTPLDVFLQRQRVVDLRDLLAAHPSLRNIRMSDGKTKLLDLLDAMRSWQTFRWYLENHANGLFVEKSSPLCPGFNAFHFAVLFSDRASSEFHELRARRGNEEVDSGDRGRVRIDWLYDECCRRGVENFARRGAAGRASPLRLAFSLQRSFLVQTTLDHFYEEGRPDYLIDEDGWSFLHYACGWSPAEPFEPDVVDDAIADGAEVNLPLGSSIQLKCQTFHPEDDTPLRFFVVAGTRPLHMAVGAGHARVAERLMQHGADVNATNVEGWSPLHMVMLSGRVDIGETMLSLATNLRERVLEDVGLSHLHVACLCDNLEAVKKLIKRGSDVNAVLRFEPMSPAYSRQGHRQRIMNYTGCRSALDVLRQSGYAGFTPLHFAVKNGSAEVTRALLMGHADPLARNAEGLTPMHEALTKSEGNDDVSHLFLQELMSNASLEQRLQDAGVTSLHRLAFRMELKDVAGADVNARVKEDSPIWPGCTALHAWAYGARGRDFSQARVVDTLKVLLEAGADVTLSNAMLDTPLHVFDRSFAKDEDEIASSIGRLLLDSQRDFAVNPSNASGFSHFHVAVRMRALGVVEAFLERGVDVNQRAKSGCSALHLACDQSTYFDGCSSMLQTVDLLLKHKADVRGRDALGNTPLHLLVEDGIVPEDIAEKIIQAGGEVDAANVSGETPLAVALKSINASAQTVKFFIEHGCRVNAYNPVDQTGLLELVLAPSGRNADQLMELIRALGRPAVEFVDESGRTTIHNIVSSRAEIACNNEFIGLLVRTGCDIDAQDSSGKTALHTAVQFKNSSAVSALLAHGADVNLIDNRGKTALDYAWDECACSSQKHQHHDIIRTIWFHVKKLLLLKLDVHKRNKRFLRRVRNDHTIVFPPALFSDQVNSTKECILDSDTLRLYDFLSETGAVASYWTMLSSKREAIDNFFTKDDRSTMKSIGEIEGLLKLQYRKAARRASLIQMAYESLWSLSAIRVPELCCECVMKYLSISDIENLVASAKIRAT